MVHSCRTLTVIWFAIQSGRVEDGQFLHLYTLRPPT
jgi:hypothetical protein